VNTGKKEPAPEAVTFYSDGARIAADLFLPDGSGTGPSPAVVICHGFGGIKAFFVGDIARALAAKGYVTLTFDYRGFGESDGRRSRLFPQEQVEDVLAALTYLRSRPEVDSNRVATYGTSFGGGIAIAAAALDDRARAAVCAVGIADCERWLRSLRRHWEWTAFSHRMESDRVNRVLTGASEIVEPEEIMVRDPESVEHEKYLRATWPDRAFKLDLASGDAIMKFRPVDFLDRLGSRPLMLIGVDEDGLTAFDQTQQLYDAAAGPKELLVLTGLAHHDIYRPQHVSGLMDQVGAFLDAYVAGKQA
jgi:uncharacterized protein